MPFKQGWTNPEEIHINCLLKRNHITVSSKVYYKHMGLHVHDFNSLIN